METFDVIYGASADSAVRSDKVSILVVACLKQSASGAQ